MKRIIFGFLLFGIAVVSIMFGGVCFPLVLGFACYLGGGEFVTMAKAKGFKPSPRIVKGMIVAFFVMAALPELLKPFNVKGIEAYPLEHYPLLLTVGICASFFRLLFRNEKPPATIADIATTILGFIYVGFLPSHLILLRNIDAATISNPLLQPGLAYVWVCLFIIWATDVFAYYGGKKFGKHLLYPQISPKKTVEGAVTGLLASVFWATVVVYVADNFLFGNSPSSHISPPFHNQLWQAPLMGAVVSVAAQLGDLCESLLKRDAGMKDSSTLIPGHGGFLDRGDSLLFGSPVSYYWIWIVVLGHF